MGASEIPGLAPLIAEYDANGNLVAKYHHDGGLIAMTRGNQSYWYVFEAIGSVRQLTDTQSQVPDAYFYDAWGNELASSGMLSNPFRYVGKENYYSDGQNRLILLGVRYYDSAIGRFVSVDPSDFSTYTYVRNNPVEFVDPWGLFETEPDSCTSVRFDYPFQLPEQLLKVLDQLPKWLRERLLKLPQCEGRLRGEVKRCIKKCSCIFPYAYDVKINASGFISCRRINIRFIIPIPSTPLFIPARFTFDLQLGLMVSAIYDGCKQCWQGSGGGAISGVGSLRGGIFLDWINAYIAGELIGQGRLYVRCGCKEGCCVYGQGCFSFRARAAVEFKTRRYSWIIIEWSPPCFQGRLFCLN